VATRISRSSEPTQARSSSTQVASGNQKNGRAEACYAVWQDGRITLGSVAYDLEKTIEKLRRLSVSAAVFEDLAFVL